MRDLVKNCLRMRPERIIVGRGARTGGLRLAAGHEHRSRRLMGTLHANSPAEAPVAYRVDEVTMGGYSLPSRHLGKVVRIG